MIVDPFDVSIYLCSFHTVTILFYFTWTDEFIFNLFWVSNKTISITNNSLYGTSSEGIIISSSSIININNNVFLRQGVLHFINITTVIYKQAKVKYFWCTNLFYHLSPTNADENGINLFLVIYQQMKFCAVFSTSTLEVWIIINCHNYNLLELIKFSDIKNPLLHWWFLETPFQRNCHSVLVRSLFLITCVNPYQ